MGGILLFDEMKKLCIVRLAELPADLRKPVVLYHCHFSEFLFLWFFTAARILPVLSDIPSLPGW